MSAKNSPKDNMPLKKKESSDNSLDMNDFIQQKLYKTTNSGNSYKNPLFSKKIKNWYSLLLFTALIQSLNYHFQIL